LRNVYDEQLSLSWCLCVFASLRDKMSAQKNIRKQESKTKISKYFLGLLSIFSLFLLANSVRANNPLIIKNIANYYENIEVIYHAKNRIIIDEKILKFLLS
jgi:hypothetical protein